MIFGRPKARSIRGFTLIEVLVSMALFALVSAMTFQGLQISMKVQEVTEDRFNDFNDVQLVWTLMLRDFAHMVRRPIRNRYGTRVFRAFMPQGDGCAVSFTRYTPFSNSGLQRIAYCHDGENLYRRVWSTIDRPDVPEYREALLCKDVDSFVIEVEGLDAVKDNSPTHVYEQLPTHIKVSMNVRDFEYERNFPGLSAYDPFKDQNVKKTTGAGESTNAADRRNDKNDDRKNDADKKNNEEKKDDADDKK